MEDKLIKALDEYVLAVFNSYINNDEPQIDQFKLLIPNDLAGIILDAAAADKLKIELSDEQKRLLGILKTRE
jgi:hypothetical protein